MTKIPVLGFETKADAVREMLADNVDPEEIMRLVGCSRAYLRTVRQYDRRKQTVRITLNPDLASVWTRPAYIRGIPRATLIRNAMTVIRHHPWLIDNIMDDR